MYSGRRTVAYTVQGKILNFRESVDAPWRELLIGGITRGTRNARSFSGCSLLVSSYKCWVSDSRKIRLSVLSDCITHSLQLKLYDILKPKFKPRTGKF